MPNGGRLNEYGRPRGYQREGIDAHIREVLQKHNDEEGLDMTEHSKDNFSNLIERARASLGRDQWVMALIPARGGSKGIKDKNLRTVAGKALAAWSVDAANRSTLVHQTCVSSDSKEILEKLSNFGAHEIERPAFLATDEAPVFWTLIHAVSSFKSKVYDTPPTWVVLLEPTHVFKTASMIDAAVAKAIETGADTVVTTEDIPDPRYTRRVIRYGRVYPLGADVPLSWYGVRRVDNPTITVPDGCVYVLKVDSLSHANGLFGPHTESVPTEIEHSGFDIDTEDDLVMADVLMRRQTTLERVVEYPPGAVLS